MRIPVFETGAFSHSAISPNPPTITIAVVVSGGDLYINKPISFAKSVLCVVGYVDATEPCLLRLNLLSTNIKSHSHRLTTGNADSCETLSQGTAYFVLGQI
jgi:hypothetical protein